MNNLFEIINLDDEDRLEAIRNYSAKPFFVEPLKILCRCCGNEIQHTQTYCSKKCQLKFYKNKHYIRYYNIKNNDDIERVEWKRNRPWRTTLKQGRLLHRRLLAIKIFNRWVFNASGNFDSTKKRDIEDLGLTRD